MDLLTISKLLGHASFSTTMVYLHCRREHLISAPSPLDWLPVQPLPTYQPPAENNPNGNPGWQQPQRESGRLGEANEKLSIAPMRLLETYPRPSWREIFSRGSELMPRWYAESLEVSERAFWDGSYREGFSGWYLKTPIESA